MDTLRALVILLVNIAVSGANNSSGYVTYFGGTLPLILSAPHGGQMEPEDVPDRKPGCWQNGYCNWRHDCGEQDEERCRVVTENDYRTGELALELYVELYRQTGEYPHLIINELKRNKLDANRDMYQAAMAIPQMEAAWTEYQRAIYRAKSEVQAAGASPGLVLDLHGQSHDHGWLEIGYLIRGSSLDIGDFDINQTSIRALANRISGEHSAEEVIRGDLSLGALLQREGVQCVPSPIQPGPAGAPYYNGGYNTRTHGSVSGGVIDAIQLESPYALRKDSARHAYVGALARALVSYLQLYYEYQTVPDTGSEYKHEMLDNTNGCSRLGPRSHFFSNIQLLLIFCIMKYLYGS